MSRDRTKGMMVERGEGKVRVRRCGYVSTMVVLSISLICIAMLLVAYSARISSVDHQMVSQLKSDYSQREDALLRALVAIVPNKAIQAMQSGAATKADELTWNAIFEEALDVADAESAMTADMIADLGLAASLRSGNIGDSNIAAVSSVISPVDGGTGLVTPGTGTQPAGDYPPFLAYAGSVNDATYPLISNLKTWGLNAAGYATLSTTTYSDYNLIPYPDIRFGYVEQGGLFVAKRNWWAFNVTYGAEDAAATGVPTETRTYVLSIYEVPTQIPLTADSFMELGRFADGSAWTGVTVEGGAYAETVKADSAVNFDRLASRKGFDAAAGMTVGGESVTDSFQTDGSLDTHVATTGSFFPASVSADAGRVAFIPLNVEFDFYEFIDNPVDTNTLSDTPWATYTMGAHQAKMKVVVDAVQNGGNQMPTQITFTYVGAGGAEQTITWSRTAGELREAGSVDDSWTIPFLYEAVGDSTPCLTVDLERLQAYLLANGADPAVNNSLAVNPDHVNNTDIIRPAMPVPTGQMGIALRGSQDMTGWTSGFSLVTNVRLYIAEDFNMVEATVPVGSGLSSSEPYFPPISIFAPSVRWGAEIDEKLIDFSGSLASTKTDGDSFNPANPLDLKTGLGNSVSVGDVEVDLKPIKSPAELPPIHLKNWLVTIDRVR
ncbi:hypothetical protein [Sulfuriroseicoccus oceanibius]|uniref:Uncharacterized protein n=1 Tax=Sulfuriroseicoccus oceanibius TaxID=2707525 RepID=A0A6B3LA18_9BACT|nr:hypothetical protein [Sulfuriroseicoccus oceanibius]QQL43743.1 hypothetical protein G3M56_007465 [Sulfuriroseicoccus oceanibius]